MHQFSEDFYGSQLSVCVAGYIRPEKKFKTLGICVQYINHTDVYGIIYTITNSSP